MNDSKEVFANNKSLEDLEGEVWKPIRNSKVYFISNYGRVKSKNHHQMMILEQQKNNKGYWRVSLSLEKGKAVYYLVSRLVAEAFSPDGDAENKEVHHTKGKDCNSADSLVYLTKEEHTQEHRRMKGKEADGEK